MTFENRLTSNKNLGPISIFGTHRINNPVVIFEKSEIKLEKMWQVAKKIIENT